MLMYFCSFREYPISSLAGHDHIGVLPLKDGHALIAADDLVLLVDDDSPEVAVAFKGFFQLLTLLLLNLAGVAEVELQISNAALDHLNPFIHFRVPPRSCMKKHRLSAVLLDICCPLTALSDFLCYTIIQENGDLQ